MEVADSSLEQLVSVVRHEAFLGLLHGSPVTISRVAARRGVPLGRARAALDQLVAAGAAEVVEDVIVGAHGLTTGMTPHAIAVHERLLHTWCALDAVGIPVALAVDALAMTTCPTCGARLNVPVRAGAAKHLPFVLWLPTGPCAHLTRDFCAAANLFCNAAHLDPWRRDVGDPQGQAVSLAELEDLARRSWADVADEGRTLLGAGTREEAGNESKGR